MRGKILKIAIAVLVVMAVGCVLIMPSQQAEERIPSVSLSSFVCHVVEQKMDEKILQEADVSLNFKHAEIYNGETLHLMASLGTKVKERDIVSSWTVSNPAIASVDYDGTVRGKATGSTEVTVTAINGKTASATVDVYIDETEAATSVPVLTYHRVPSDAAKAANYAGDNLALPASSFEAQMDWLDDNGYTTISTEQLRAWMQDGAFLPKKSVLLTFDDGLYETYHIVYPILAKHNFKGCAFVIGSLTSETTEAYDPTAGGRKRMGTDAIEEIRRDYPNFEIQSHTYDLHTRMKDGNGVATIMTREEIDADFEQNRKFGFTAIAYPFGHAPENLVASAAADPDIRIGFGYQMTWPAVRWSPIYEVPRYKVYGEWTLNDFVSTIFPDEPLPMPEEGNTAADNGQQEDGVQTPGMDGITGADAISSDSVVPSEQADESSSGAVNYPHLR